ncbi:hypothetical protein LEP1GSC061_0960 [Leptospira wolffii serovar Khorat str. Khorat-H2]|nr:hypothetical protein LEP1GSC061_0960 [Leptospira wolffii serovar Khorat str. Khorat-H2]
MGSNDNSRVFGIEKLVWKKIEKRNSFPVKKGLLLSKDLESF